jgi:hypothetical protein
LERGGRPPKQRLDANQTQHLRKLLRAALRSSGKTQSDLDAELKKGASWTKHVLNRDEEVTFEDARIVADYLRRNKFASKGTIAWANRRFLEWNALVEANKRQGPIPILFPPIFVLEEDVKLVSIALAEYLRKRRVNVSPDVVAGFFNGLSELKTIRRENYQWGFAGAVKQRMGEVLESQQDESFELEGVTLTPESVRHVLLNLELLTSATSWKKGRRLPNSYRSQKRANG